jgi:diguanylate cyclase (GGDEF)-like protein
MKIVADPGSLEGGGQGRNSIVAQALTVSLADRLQVPPEALGEVDPQTAAIVLRGLLDSLSEPPYNPILSADTAARLGQEAVAECIRLRLAVELDIAPERLASVSLLTAALLLDRLSGRMRRLAADADSGPTPTEPHEADANLVERILSLEFAEQLGVPPAVVQDVPVEVASLILLRLVQMTQRIRDLRTETVQVPSAEPPVPERRDTIARIMRNTIAGDVNLHPRLLGHLSPVAAAVVLAKFAEDHRGLSAVRAQLAVDELTGTLRRVAGQEALEREIRRARRLGGGQLVLGFADVDSLKRRNDEAGHAAGDELLKTLANSLRNRLRAYDVVARWGGDEFICILPQTDVEAAESVLAQVLQEFSEAAGGYSFTVGFAALSDDDTAEELVARADGDLYRKKARRPPGGEAAAVEAVPAEARPLPVDEPPPDAPDVAVTPDLRSGGLANALRRFFS